MSGELGFLYREGEGVRGFWGLRGLSKRGKRAGESSRPAAAVADTTAGVSGFFHMTFG